MASNERLNFEEVLQDTQYIRDRIEEITSYMLPSFFGLSLTVRLLIHGPDGAGKRMLMKLACKKLEKNFTEARVAELFDENIVGTQKKVRAMINKLAEQAPCLIYLTGYEIFASLEEADLDLIADTINDTLLELTKKQGYQPIIFVGSTNDFVEISKTKLLEAFHYDVAVKPLTSEQSLEVIDAINKMSSLKRHPIRWLETIPKSELYLGSIIDLLAKLEFDNEMIEKVDGVDEEGEEGVHWSDVGGLDEVKKEIRNTIQMYMEFPQLRNSGLKRTGILLYGPPGTGKTLIAKAVATECDLSFFNVKGPELLNKYVGQSEDNIRQLFARARESSPAVIFFDELDSLAPNRGQAGDSGGVMDRVVSQLLAEMDGINRSEIVFVIGATNRIDLVDRSLLRPGRFDKVLEVSIPTDKQSRVDILRALTRKMSLSADVDMERLESLARPGWSGADLRGLCSRAQQVALDRVLVELESARVSEDEARVVVTMQDFISSAG